ncbi:MAG: hypothetical protein KGY67_00310 [Candidatus Thermoplasmatota archaeon]|nr:hypothetical protein [Candidatus Thermoplasmatota archaeon]
MEIKEFVDRIKKAKKTFKESDEYTKGLTVRVNKKRTKFILSKQDKCSCCGHIRYEFMNIEFYNPEGHLTLFESGMLYALFVKNKLVKDYHKYHNCIAGKQFIENIKKIETI